MNNHKVYDYISYNIKFKILSYYEDDDNDYKFINKFIKRNNCCIILQKNASTIFNNTIFHSYYNPGTYIDKITYYYDNDNICSFYDNDKNKERIVLNTIRKIKLEKLIRLNEI